MAMLDNQMVFVKCGLSSPVWIFSMDGTHFMIAIGENSIPGMIQKDFHSSDGGKES